ncbi:MAG: FG-GAP repeat protein [Alphaproteobacteria bacterium]|nr:FG-GAP repeat protein [Alphaproteobacteria bacterium]
MEDAEPVVWEAPDDLGYAGYPLTLAGDRLLVSAVGVPGSYGSPRVWSLDSQSLEPVGDWSFPHYNVWGVGAAHDAADVDGDGLVEVLVGAPSYRHDRVTRSGAALLFDEAPEGTVSFEDPPPWFEQTRTPYVYAGSAVTFLDDTASGQVVAVVGGPGTTYPATDALIAVVDPTRGGPLTETDASSLFSGGPGCGGTLDAMDVDADGRQDLVARTDRGVGYLLAPLPAGEHALRDVLDGEWTAGDGPNTSLGLHLSQLADVTGDGLQDLAFSDYEQEVRGAPRAGAAWVVAGGDPRPGSVDGLPIRVEGTEVGEGVAYGITSGDLDGDGQPDLVLGAPGVYPGIHPGKVVVFRGPVADGTYTTGDADAVLYGESDWDLFGFAVLAADTTGDDRAELYVGAPGSPRESGRGSVYLLPGGSVF